ncbi:hypothetical protein [Blastococcus sp. LR1]|uniref:hypothetical protein n=1 Tax=Blastococcus sp. LR1 TaxID=2877000 RepID=UPI001CCDE539|nr:hypothetical protein [Blastococcus sp. LR1]MCA0143849.1 hypothetical protein [Blastococcus sp. LR1]
MLELGKAGSLGVDKHDVPVVRDGAVVATLHGKRSKQPGTATIGAQTWLLEQSSKELTARLPGEPEHAARLRASRVSMWKGTWTAELEGTPVQVQTASHWTSTHRYLIGERVIAETGSTGGWAPRATLTAEPDLPLHHQVFLLWLESTLRGSADGTAAVFGDGDGGGGGGD